MVYRSSCQVLTLKYLPGLFPVQGTIVKSRDLDTIVVCATGSTV